jgi:uncharacterized membrane protein HdeD (DUF308 family)
MSTAFTTPGTPTAHELHPLRSQWWCFLLLGITLVVIGSLCIVDPLVSSVASMGAVMFLGFLLLAAGITQIVSSIWAGRWSGMLMHVLVGVLYSVVGYMIIDAPGTSLVVLTKLVAIFLIVSGVFRIVASLMTRFHDWGWVLLNGCVTLLLGLIINRQLPEAALWVIGLFLGIELVFNGWAWIMLALGLRAVHKAG